MVKAAFLTLTVFVLLTIGGYVAQAQGDYISLEYVVEPDAYSVLTSDISPRYLLLEDGMLLFPVQTVIQKNEAGPDLQNIRLFVLDLHNGVAARVGSYERVFGMSMVRSAKSDEVYYGVRESPHRRGEFRDYRVNVETVNVVASDLDEIQANRALDQNGVSPYPDVLIRNAPNDIYRNTATYQVLRYAWRQWHDHIVALGRGDPAGEEFTLHLYGPEGSTEYVLPEIRVYGRSFAVSPHVILVSPDEELLMLHDSVASRAARLEYPEADIDRAMYFWRFTDVDPTAYYETRVYYLSSPDFGAGHAVGEWFEVESTVVNGAPFSTVRTTPKARNCE